ncbi:MAG: polysaccharide deacetylase family protein [Sphingomonadales bacterium]
MMSLSFLAQTSIGLASSILAGLLKAFAAASILPASAAAAMTQPPAPDGATPEAVILLYHRFGEDDVPSTNIRLDQFDAQLDWLAEQGAHFISLDDLLTAFEQGRPLPEFAIAITADDAFRSIAEQAWPRLKARGIPLALFVATDAVSRGQGRYLDWDGVRALARDGVSIGHHGGAHAHMAGLSPAAARADLEAANDVYKRELGAVPALLAYPYGEYDPALARLARDLGFRAAFAQFSSVATASGERFALPRFAINESYGRMERFRLVARARALPVASFQPTDPWLGDRNPPAMRLVLEAGAGGFDQLTCYASTGANAVPLARDGRTVRLMLDKPFPPGRGRVNCTHPGPDGRWYWFGRPVFVSGGAPD